MIKIQSIRLKNFMSYEDMEHHFDDNTLTLIYGRVGTGKSSMPDGLIWTLFGKTKKGATADSIVNRKNKKNCSGALSFVDKNNYYELVRYRKHDKHKNSILLSVNGADHEIVDQTEIDSIVGITYNLFVIANVISSNDISSNILELGAQRNGIFGEIFGLSALEKYEKSVTANLSQIRKELEEVTPKLSIAMTKKDTLQASVNEFEEQKEIKRSNIQKQIDELEQQKSKLKDLDEIEELISKYEDQATAIENAEEYLSESGSEFFDQSDKIKQVKNSISIIDEEIKKLKNSKCLVCGHKLSPTALKKLQDEKKREKKQLQNLLKELNINLDKLKKEHTSNEEILEDAQKVLEEYKTAISKYLKSDDVFKEYNDKVEQNKKIDRDIETAKRLLTDIDYGIFAKTQQNEIDKVIKIIPELKEREKHLKEEQQYWQFWKDASDIKQPGNYKVWRIRNIIKDFNTILGDFVNLFFRDDEISNVSISFNDDLTEKIIVDGIEQPYSLFSRGQKKKLNNAVNFAFYRTVRKFVKPIPFLFVDEAMDGLDDSSQHAILDYLQDLAKDTCVNIISHNDAIKNSIDKSYIVRMEDGFSKIEAVI